MTSTIKRTVFSNNMYNVNPNQYKKEIGFMFRYLKRKKPKEITKNIKNKPHNFLTGLDVGAGCGQYSEVLREKGLYIVALDCNKLMLRESDHPKVLGIGKKLPYKDNVFDFSFIINVLHHTDKPVEILKEMKRVSGIIIISELNKENLFVKAFIKSRLKFDNYEDHLSEKELRNYIEKSGLKLVKFYRKSLFKVPRVFMWAMCE